MLNSRTTRLIGYFLQRYPRKSALIVLLLILSGFAEGFGVLSILPLLELAVGDPGDRSGVMAWVEGVLGRVGLEPTLGVLLLCIVAGMLLKGGFMWLAVRQQGYAVAAIATDLRLSMIRALLRARWSYFLSQRTGHLSNSIGHEAQVASMAYANACSLLAVVVQILVYAGIAFLISPMIAVSALLAGAALILILGGLVRMSRLAGRRQIALIKSLSARLVDAAYGIKPIKAMARERHLQPLLETETRELNEAQRRHVLASGTLASMQEPMLTIVLAGGLFVLLTFVEVPFATLLVMAFLFHRLVGRVNLLQTFYQSVAWSEGAFWSLREAIDSAEAELDRHDGEAAAPPLRDAIELRGVEFGYTGESVLRDVSVRIPAGAFVALTGPSGAGKTTFVDLITGLHRPRAGEIVVDGVPLERVDMAAWRRRIGYVPQELLLFHDTVRANVTLGDPDIGDADVLRALEEAGAREFVAALPQGLDTVIGERGAQLSGGQRQRISIARALVHRPVLLVLDEATTALDPATERAICRTLQELRRTLPITVLAISHQPALQEAADLVFRLQDGQVVESFAGPLAPIAPAANA